MPCVDAIYDTAQFDISEFDTICEAADTPTSITVTIDELNTSTITSTQDNTSIITTAE